MNMEVAGEGLERFADGGLFADDQRQRSEIGKHAVVGHAQPELLYARFPGGKLEQLADADDGNAHVGAVKAAWR